MARMTKAAKLAEKARIEVRDAEACRIVNTGKCPQCGCNLRRNMALTGWYQCVQYGAVGFRANSDKPSCSFQIFTK